MRRASLTGLSVLVLIAVTTAAWLARDPVTAGATGWSSMPEPLRPVLWPEPRRPAEFSLHDQAGDPFNHQSLQGRWNLVFFGYLDCPDICPMSLAAMRQMRRMLIERTPSARDVRFILVSVDDVNDDPVRMRAYLAGFDADFVGLTGNRDEIRKLTDSLAVHYRKLPDSPVNAIDHTSSLVIIDPQGRAIGALQPPLLPERMIDAFELVREFQGDS